MSVFGGSVKRKPCLSNCSTCDHIKQPDGGYCYMFREAPEGVCYCHSGLKEPFGVIESLIRSGAEFSRQKRKEVTND